MKTRYLLVVALSLLVGLGTAGVATADPRAQKSSPTVSFEAGDRPGNFFTCSNTANSKSLGCVNATARQRSLAVIAPGETVGFPTYSGEASTIHTAVSLLWPKGAKNMPFKAAIDFRDPAKRGVATVKLWKPGLYVFICDIHVYMFATVIVDDPVTKVKSPDNIFQGLGLDLGKEITLINGITVPTASDLALRLVKTNFMITDPDNWKDYNKTDWQPKYPPVPVIAYAANPDPKGSLVKVPVPNLNTLLQSEAVNAKAELHNPSTPAVGEIWVDTQFELTAGKSKPGTATAIDGGTWALTKKIALPATNMNHPHNMWTDRNQEVIYQTQWFDERLTVFDRKTGAFIRELNAGPAPSHVMTRANNDLVHVAQNGGNNVREFDTLAKNNTLIRDIPMTNPSVDNFDIFKAAHPHGHWMSSTGDEMVTPNENINTSTVYNFTIGDIGPNGPRGAIEATIDTGHIPIATGMMPDSSKYYVSNFLDSTISVMNMTSNTEITKINLIEKYNPVEGCYSSTNPTSTPDLDCSFVGALPIQTPVSPDGTNMVTANTLTATITVVDTRHKLPDDKVNPNEDKVVATLPCDPGCHGVQYGAKNLTDVVGPTGGYYAYVANKFSNAMIVVDPDPNGDGDPSDAAIVGRVLLGTMGAATTDVSNGVSNPVPNPDMVIGNAGMGGQGVLPIPVVYHGWVQNLPDPWKCKLSSQQLNPIGTPVTPPTCP